MNKEDYVSLEVAKILEKKGFNEPCDSRHIVYDDGRYKFERYRTFDIQKDIGIAKIKDGCFYDSYLAPTLYEAQKWIRTNHNIHIEIGNCGSGYYWSLNKANSGRFICDYVWNGPNDGGCWDTYEETLSAGILEALKLI